MGDFLSQVNEAFQHNQELIIAALVLGRIMPMVMLTPFFGGKIVPPELKMGIGVMFTIVVWPLARGMVDVPLSHSAGPFLLLMLKEIFIGFAVGFTNAHIFYALDMSGRLIDTVRGTSMSEVQDPTSKQRVTPVGSMFVQLFLIIFMFIGGHRIFLQAFALSFETLPVHQTLNWGGAGFMALFEHMMRLTGDVLMIAVVFAAPVMAATFITDVVFGILNRVAPQLNAYFMSMPVKAMGGLIMIFVAFGALVGRFEEFAEWGLLAAERTLELLFS